MRKILFIIIALTAVLHATAQSYLPILQDGKEWLFQLEIRSYEAPYSPVTKQLREWIDGDTIVGDVRYWKHYREDVAYQSTETQTYRQLLREDGQKVYAKSMDNEAEETLLYDFGIGVGERFNDLLTVDGTDVVCAYGSNLKRIDFGQVKWVEGVGSSHSLSNPYGQMLSDGITRRLLECRVDGQCIFTQQDFLSAPVVTGINGASTVRHDKQPIYDLQGRRLPQQPQRGMFIKDGKKVMGR